MAEKFSQEDLHKALFMNLVIMLSSTVMQQLGKLVNPITKKTEVDLQGAQATIDMLSMIEARTKGNLDKDEERLLKQTLASLQMNYVETARSSPSRPLDESRGKPAQDKSKTEPAAGPSQEFGTGPSAERGASKKDVKDPKYHKSYE